jgi:hypothetical protein
MSSEVIVVPNPQFTEKADAAVGPINVPACHAAARIALISDSTAAHVF